MEREGQIIACAALFPFFKEKCGEVACIAVSPECRGEGQGDKLLGMILVYYKNILLVLMLKFETYNLRLNMSLVSCLVFWTSLDKRK